MRMERPIKRVAGLALMLFLCCYVHPNQPFITCIGQYLTWYSPNPSVAVRSNFHVLLQFLDRVAFDQRSHLSYGNFIELDQSFVL